MREMLLLDEQINLSESCVKQGRISVLEKLCVRDKVLPRVLSQDSDTLKSSLELCKDFVSCSPLLVKRDKVNIKLEVVL